MSTDRDVTRTVRSWLEDGVTALPDRLLDEVLDQLQTTQQRRATWPAGRLPMPSNNFVRIGLAAAIVVALAVVGFNVFGGRDVGTAVPSVVASPSSPSGPLPFPTDGGFGPGTYVISEPFPLEIEMELAGGWYPWTPGVGVDVAAMFQNSADPPSGRVLIFSIVDEVFSDACDGSSELVDPGPGVADLATALADQASTDASEPVEVTIGGYTGLYLDYVNTGECGTLQRWVSVFGNREALGLERDQVWILDVDGVRLVIDAASFSDTEESALAEMRTIVESLTIRP